MELSLASMPGVKGKSGGAREGSGPKFKYNEPTTAIRVPNSLLPKIEAMLKKIQEKQAKKKK